MELTKILKNWRKNYGERPIDVDKIIAKLKANQRPMISFPNDYSKPNYRPVKPSRPYKPQRPGKPDIHGNDKPNRPTGLNLSWAHLSALDSNMWNRPTGLAQPQRPGSPERPASPQSPVLTDMENDVYGTMVSTENPEPNPALVTEPEPAWERQNTSKPNWYDLMSGGGFDSVKPNKPNGQNRPQMVNRPHQIPIRPEKPNKPSKNPSKRPNKGTDRLR